MQSLVHVQENFEDKFVKENEIWSIPILYIAILVVLRDWKTVIGRVVLWSCVCVKNFDKVLCESDLTNMDL